jgi:hypothetical protein
VAAIRHAQRTDSPRATALEKMSAADIAWACASLGWRYFEAKLLGDTATAELMKGAMIGSTCDARWIHTLNDYLKYFGPNGTRREIPYVRADKVGPKVITIKAGAKIGLIGDWGTGAEPAKLILRQLKAQNPNIVIHLGDIYYSGTDEECRVNFEAVVDDVLERSKSTIPVCQIASNRDPSFASKSDPSGMTSCGLST